MRKYVFKIMARQTPEPNWLSDSVFFSCGTSRVFHPAFTLVEVLIVVLIIGTLFGIGIPIYTTQLDRARSTKAISDIYAISQQIEEFYLTNGAYPTNLAIIGRAKTRDPWGNPYEYLNIEAYSHRGKKGKGRGVPGHARKDRFLVPLNTDYDLYSKGKDGESKPPLTAKASWDDVVRANNGGFIGEARKY